MSQKPIPYVAFLRAINVGGHQIIAKAKLIEAFEAAGLDEVKTFIQSGNVLFSSTKKDQTRLLTSIHKALHEATGHDLTIMIRTRAEIAALVESDPFGKDKEKPKTTLYVAFLDGEPSTEGKQKLLARQTDDDRVEIRGADSLHLITKEPGTGERFTTNFVEKDLGVKATVRNWNTVTKIAAL